MHDAAIDWVRVDVVFPRDLEAPGGIRAYEPLHVAECAADVDVRYRVRRDQAGIVAAPSTGDHLWRRTETDAAFRGRGNHKKRCSEKSPSPGGKIHGHLNSP